MTPPVLVRSSTNKDKDEPGSHHISVNADAPHKQASPLFKEAVNLVKESALAKTEKFFKLFSNKVDDEHLADMKYYNIQNRATSLEDLQDVSPVCTNTRSSRLKRFSSNHELPSENRHGTRRNSELKYKQRAPPRLKKKTFSALFSNQGSSIYLDCSKLNSRRESQICMDNKHNHGIRRASVLTLGDCYAQYNSESSLNSYYDQVPSVHHEDTGSTEMIITARGYDESLTVKDSDDLDYDHIKFVNIFAMIYCWCFPVTGILSVIYSKRAKKHYNEREMTQAKGELSRAQHYLFMTFLGGFVLIVIGLTLLYYFVIKKGRFLV